MAAARFVKLTDETMRDLEVAPDGRWAVGRDTRGYISDYKRPAADIYRVNTSTGERTLMLKGQLTGSHVFGISPDGQHFLYWKDNKFQAYDLDAATSRTLGNGVARRASSTSSSIIRVPSPPYGIAGYTADGKSVIVQHRYDLWLLPLDGSPPRNLTNGVGQQGGDPVPLRPDRAARTQPGSIGGAAAPAIRAAAGSAARRRPRRARRSTSRSR